jgi:serine/threonine protein kinase
MSDPSDAVAEVAGGFLTNIYTSQVIPCGLNLQRNRFTIGRSRNNDYVINTEGISKEHFNICYENSKFFLEILSNSGTNLNDTLHMGDRHELKDGDVISPFTGASNSHSYIFTTGRKEPKYIKTTRSLGKGGFSKVSLGIDLRTFEIVAMKYINIKKTKDVAERTNSENISINAEIEKLKDFNHPNIVVYRDHFDEGDETVIVTEFLGGGHFLEWYRNSRGSYKHLFRGMAEGLAYLHQMQIAHRDIKPDNILVTTDGLTAKISDFGISKSNLKPTDPTSHTNIGTEEYLPPEMRPRSKKFHGVLNPVDIWALGTLFYYVETGKYPECSSVNGRDVVTLRLSRIEDIDLRDLIERMLQANPLDRIDIQGVLNHNWWDGGNRNREIVAVQPSLLVELNQGAVQEPVIEIPNQADAHEDGDIGLAREIEVNEVLNPADLQADQVSHHRNAEEVEDLASYGGNEDGQQQTTETEVNEVLNPSDLQEDQVTNSESVYSNDQIQESDSGMNAAINQTRGEQEICQRNSDDPESRKNGEDLNPDEHHESSDDKENRENENLESCNCSDSPRQNSKRQRTESRQENFSEQD